MLSFVSCGALLALEELERRSYIACNPADEVLNSVSNGDSPQENGYSGLCFTTIVAMYVPFSPTGSCHYFATEASNWTKMQGSGELLAVCGSYLSRIFGPVR